MSMNEQIDSIILRIDTITAKIEPKRAKIGALRLLVKAIRHYCDHEYELVEGTVKSGTERCSKCGDSYRFSNEYGELSVMEYGKRVGDVDLYVAKHDLKKYQEQLAAVDTGVLLVDESTLIRGYLGDMITTQQKRIEEIAAAIEERKAT